VIKNSIGEGQCLLCGRSPYERDPESLRLAIKHADEEEREKFRRQFARERRR
jgi:hypothetical protein